MLEFEQIVKTAYWIILGMLFIILAGRYIYFQKTNSIRINVQEEKLIFKYFDLLLFWHFLYFFFGIISFVFVLQRGNMFAFDWLKNALLISLAAVLATEILYNYLIN